MPKNDGATEAQWPIYNKLVREIGMREAGERRVAQSGLEVTVPSRASSFSAKERTRPLLAWGSWDGTVKLWNVATGTERASLQSTVGPVNSVAISPDAKTVAAGGRNGTIQLWKIPEP